MDVDAACEEEEDESGQLIVRQEPMIFRNMVKHNLPENSIVQYETVEYSIVEYNGI